MNEFVPMWGIALTSRGKFKNSFQLFNWHNNNRLPKVYFEWFVQAFEIDFFAGVVVQE